MNTESQDLKIASQLLKEHEELCAQQLGGTTASILKMEEIKEILERYGYEFCSHNAAILGSNRYKKYQEPGINVLITSAQYDKLKKEQQELEELED